jgi:hypothetical protein
LNNFDIFRFFSSFQFPRFVLLLWSCVVVVGTLWSLSSPFFLSFFFVGGEESREWNIHEALTSALDDVIGIVVFLRGEAAEVLVLLLLLLQKRRGIAVYLILVVAVRCIVGEDFDTGERTTFCSFGVRLFLHRCLFTAMMY